jgi:hypothetical protein
MTTPTDPPSEGREGAPPCAPTPTPADLRRAAMDRLWAGHQARSARVQEQQKAEARKKAAARARKYRQTRPPKPPLTEAT